MIITLASALLESPIHCCRSAKLTKLLNWGWTILVSLAFLGYFPPPGHTSNWQPSLNIVDHEISWTFMSYYPQGKRWILSPKFLKVYKPSVYLTIKESLVISFHFHSGYVSPTFVVESIAVSVYFQLNEDGTVWCVAKIDTGNGTFWCERVVSGWVVFVLLYLL